MGRVYLGAADDGTLVAIKVVHPGLADDASFRARFRREVEISGRVTGPGIAAVVDADAEAELPWLASQYVPGPSLEKAVRSSGPLPEAAVRDLGRGLALALAAIHAAGLVHRDVKPSNVLLEDAGPRLIDFGISRAVDGTRMTSTGLVIGTPAFMSPEQISGEGTGPESDVFSLGSVLFYAATGCGPFGDLEPVVLMLRISQHEPDLTGVPEGMRRPIAACLAKRPDDRPTAAELAELLGPGADGPPGRPAEPGPVAGPTEHWPGTGLRDSPAAPRGISRRVWLGMAGAVGLTAAAGVGLSAFSGRTAGPDVPASAGPEPVPSGRSRWRTELPLVEPVDGNSPAGGHMLAAGAVDGVTLYTCVLEVNSDQSTVLAVDIATGLPRWTAPIPDSKVRNYALATDRTSPASVVLADDVLVVATATVLAGLAPRTGSTQWELPAGDPEELDLSIRPMVVGDGVVVVTDATEGLVARDIRTGEQRWSHRIGDEAGNPQLAVRNGVCFHLDGNTVQARDLSTGSEVWAWSSDTGADALVIADDVVVVGPRRTTCLDAATGQERWGLDVGTGTAAAARSVGVVGDAVVMPAGGATVRALEVRNGAERWSSADPRWEDGVDLLGADGKVYVVPRGEGQSGSPAPSRGRMVAIDAETGTEQWAFEPTEAFRMKPIAAHRNDVYVFDESGHLEALAGP